MNTNHHSNDRPAWIDQANRVLDDSVRDLDAATLSRLNRARQAALAQQRPRTPRAWLLPAGLASACALLLAVIVWQPHRHIETQQPAPIATGASAAVDDGDSEESTAEFYQNLEFYAWLDAQNKGGDG
ncbi:MAG: hypothetical protein JSS42_13610 [Proteobacteria bacterium]|uniref:hypothetical protein n=1 Tax=Rudaea sp. TaxID=2136325 RepID=UPI0032206FB3|nr:hypothetical protein [Pseudomonadota bacterium]